MTNKSSFWELLEGLYPGKGKEMVGELEKVIGESGRRPANSRAVRRAGWYKRLQLYVTYADTFVKDGRADFYTLTEKLEYIRDLECNAVHVLPFFASPMVDMGFDVSDFYQVRSDLGGNEAFEKFLEEARMRDMRVFVDLILNHVSEEHEWFKRALAGENFYRQFFISRKERPKFVKRFMDKGVVWAGYRKEEKVPHQVETSHGFKSVRDDKGDLRSLSPLSINLEVIFPDQAGEIPHWVKGKDGYWYFHTFYPQQMDLNWDNPEVFKAMAQVLVFWVKRGVNFRLDAAAHIGKDVERGKLLNTQKAHLILRGLNRVAKMVDPEAVFLVEVGGGLRMTMDYFGVPDRPEAELAYNFELESGLWWALIFRDGDRIWEVLRMAKDVPQQIQWVTFLRNHDELKLNYLNEERQKKLFAELVKRGLPFRESDVAGRTASFLGGDEKRITMAYLLLASLPGDPAIIYGDELGKENDREYMTERTAFRMETVGLSKDRATDAREINRGQIDDQQLGADKARRIKEEISRIFKKRREYVEVMATEWPKRLDVQEGVFGCKYKKGQKDLLALVNLKDEEAVIPFKGEGRVVLEVNGGRIENQEVRLPKYGGVWMEVLI